MRSNLAKALRATATLTGAAIAIAGTFTVLEGRASACGGCFIPTENPTVVTDHRMILSVSKDQSTLYDQIKYAGNPSSFAWVLPISGTVEVGLSADIVFQALDGMTQTQITPPPRNCPPPPDCGFKNAGVSASAPSEAGGADNGGVTVTKVEVVGPYETVQLKATDPAALAAWLAKNGFNVPADVQPVVDQYVNEKFDFLALKLIPGKTVQDMRPVRVTTKGASSVLPLRMVAAGTGATVGIGLWVVAEGRYETQNFPSFVIPTTDIAWDWTQNKSNYTELRAEKTTAGAGKAWEIESSILVPTSNVQNAVLNGYYYNGNGGGGGAPAPAPVDPEAQAQQAYLPVLDAQGAVVKTAQQVRTEDLATLFNGVPTGSARVTRMRADLAHAALSADLVMTASQDQTELSNLRQLTKELNEPLCPVYNGCDQTGQAPRSEAISRANAGNGGNETFGCSTSSRTSSPAWLGLGGGFLALALVKAARRRRG
jgi:hypothetical protein